MGEICVPFEYKDIADKAGLTFNAKTNMWKGTKAQIDTYNDNLIIFDTIKEQLNAEPEKVEPEIYFSNIWDKITIQKTNNLALINLISLHGMPSDENKRIQILNKLSYKKPGEYPIYYDDIIFYSEHFKAIYPREKVNALIIKHNITGKDIINEIKLSGLNDEDIALLNFVFS